MMDVTPVEKHGNLWFKRDDLFELGGMYGAKVRACLALCQQAKEQGYTSVVSAGSRYSPQLAILGTVAKHLGLHAFGVTASGEKLPFIQQAESLGVDIHQVKYGYSNVIQKRARDLAKGLGAYLIPFGMKDELSIELTSLSFIHNANDFYIHNPVCRLVLIAGSGVNLVGVLRGMKVVSSWVSHPIPVVAVLVGHDCRGYVYSCCPWATDDKVLSFIKYDAPYHSLSVYNQVNGVDVDSRYEGKAISFLKPGDLFWLIGKAVTSPVGVSKEV